MLSGTHTFHDWTIDNNSKYPKYGGVIVSQAHNPVGAIVQTSKKISASWFKIGKESLSMLLRNGEKIVYYSENTYQLFTDVSSNTGASVSTFRVHI